MPVAHLQTRFMAVAAGMPTLAPAGSMLDRKLSATGHTLGGACPDHAPNVTGDIPLPLRNPAYPYQVRTKAKSSMHILGRALVAMALLTSVPAFAQDSDQGSAPPPADQSAALKAQYDAQKAAYEAEAAAANARAATIAAQQRAEQAKFGTVNGQTAITGTTTTTAGTAKPEAILLSSRSTRLAADQAVAEIQKSRAIRDTSREVIVLTDMADLSTSELSVFNFQAQRLTTLLASADTAVVNALRTARVPKPPEDNQDRFFTAAGAVLDLTSKLGSYFQTDYAFSGVEFTDPSNLTAGAIVGALRVAYPLPQDGAAGLVILSPGTLLPGDVGPLIQQLAPADSAYRSVVGNTAVAKAWAESIRAKDPKGAAALDDAIALAGRATTAWETFLGQLVTTTGTDAPPLVRVLRQTKLRTHLKTEPLIVLVTTQKAAAYYTKKNLWTFLIASPPLFTAGSTSLVYMVIDTKTDSVLASGAIAKHGGYKSVGGVERLFK